MGKKNSSLGNVLVLRVFNMSVLLTRWYKYAKTATLENLKKSLINYTLDKLYDLSYCRELFTCNDKQELIRYIAPLVNSHKTSNDYYRYFEETDDFKEYYYTPFFDEDTRYERIVKTKSFIKLNRIKECCFYYSLRYGFDVYELYQFMDNNPKIMLNDDDYSDDIPPQEYNDNLRVIIAPIFPQKRTVLTKGRYVDLTSYRGYKYRPKFMCELPVKFTFPDKPFHRRLPFNINITRILDENVFIDENLNRIIITSLSIYEVYRILYADRIKYELCQKHLNGTAIATDEDIFLIVDNSLERTSETDAIDEFIMSDDKYPIGNYQRNITDYDKFELIAALARVLIEASNDELSIETSS